MGIRQIESEARGVFASESDVTQPTPAGYAVSNPNFGVRGTIDGGGQNQQGHFFFSAFSSVLDLTGSDRRALR